MPQRPPLLIHLRSRCMSSDRELSFAEAIREALTQSMEADEKVILIGEDIGAFGGAFTVTQGLLETFGPERVRDTPISETAFVGTAIGLAMAGWRPVVELQFADFFGVCFDQIYNQMAKIHYMSGGKVAVPMVLRGPIGGGYGDAAQHSQCLYGAFAHFPGMKVVVPATPHDAKGLLLASIKDENPVVFLEHKLLYDLPYMIFGVTGPVPEEPYEVPIGKARIAREGKDVTIVALALMVHRALEASEELSEEGVEAEVVDLRTLVPLDTDTLLASVKKTGRMVVVDEDYIPFGVSGEVTAVVVEEDPSMLKAPVVRLGNPGIPVPSAESLEAGVIPDARTIAAAVEGLL